MRRILTTLALITTLAGCSTARTAETKATAPAAEPPEPSAQVSTPVPQVTATQSPGVKSAPPQAKKTSKPAGAGSGDARLDDFVAAVRKRLPAVALDRRDEEVEELGEHACEGLSAGRSGKAVAAEIGEQGVPAADARALVALAGDTVCAARPKV